MKKLLIVTEDLIEIQTFSGIFGNLFSRIYQIFQKIKLFLVVGFIKSFYSVTVLTTDKINLKLVTSLIYSELFDPVKSGRYIPLVRSVYQNLTDQLNKLDPKSIQFKSIPLISLWENKITSRLMTYYISYFELITRLIDSQEYSAVLILGKSTQEQIASYLCQKKIIKLIDCSWFNLNWVVKTLFQYFRTREINGRLNQFKNQGAAKPSIKLPTQPIIFSVDFFRHLKTLMPVYQVLERLRAQPLLVTDQPGLKQNIINLRAPNANFVHLANFLPPKSCRFMNDQLENIIEPRTLIFKLIYPEIIPILKRGLILSRLYLAAGDELFKKLKPKFIVVAADSRFCEITLSKLAKIYQVPSLTVSPRFILFEDEPYQYNLTDYYAVAGKKVKNQLLELKVPSRKIFISGDPRCDSLQHRLSKKIIFKKFGMSFTSKKIVLLISERPNLHFPKNEKRAVFVMVSRVVRELKNTILVIKPHPTERKYRLSEELKQWGINNAVVSDNHKIELFDLLKLSSVVTMVWSMAGLEAMLSGRPVVIINPFHKDFDKFIPYLKQEAAIEANNAKNLKKLLSVCLDKKNAKTKKLIKSGYNFARSYINYSSQQASENIAQFIINKLSPNG